MASVATSPNPRILLVRTSAMGDIIHCLPFLDALRRMLPGAEVAWVVEKVWSPILAGHPDIDLLIPVRSKAWRRKPFAAETRIEGREALAAIRAFRADIAFDLMGNHKGGFLARASRAARVVGAAGACRRERSSAGWMKEVVHVEGAHAVDQALGLLAALESPLPIDRQAAADFGGDKLLAEAPAEAQDFLQRRRQSGRPMVLIQSGAGWANKIYPLPWWAAVARDLGAAGYDVWLPTAPGEEHLAATIADQSNGAARTVDATNFAFLAALMREARLFLGGDTGPVHLAHALGTSVLSIIGPTDPERNGPYGSPDRVLFHRLPCSYCYKRFDGPRACLLSIPPRRVTEKALELLASTVEPDRSPGATRA